MAGNNDFNINILAVDKSAEAIDNAKRSFEGLAEAVRSVSKEMDNLKKGGSGRFDEGAVGKSAETVGRRFDDMAKPAQKAAQATKDLAGGASLLKRFNQGDTLGTISRGLRGVGREAQAALQGVGRLGMGLGSISEIGGAALGLAGMGAGGIAAAGLSIAALDRSWASRGVSLENQGANIGISGGELDRFERAAAGTGVSAGSVDSSLQGTAGAAFNAAYGLDGGHSAAMFRMLGVRYADAKGNPLSIDRLLPQVADAIQGRSPQQQMAAVRALGISPDMLPFLRQGGAAIKSQMAQLQAQGVGQNFQGVDKINADFVKLETAAENVADKLAQAFAPDVDKAADALTGLINAIPDWVKQWQDDTKNAGSGSVWGDLTSPAGSPLEAAADLYNAGADTGSALGNAADWWNNTYGPASVARKQALKMQQERVRNLGMSYFESQGADKKTASAILGNVQQESSFNPDADSIDPRTGQHHRGLFQWDEDRWGRLTKWAGTDHPTAQQQYQFAWRELHSPDYAGTFAAMQAAPTTGVAATAFDHGFEKSGDWQTNLGAELNREVYAEAIAALPDSTFAGIAAGTGWDGTPAPSGPPAPTSGLAAGSSGAPAGVVRVDINHNNVPAGTRTSATTAGPNVQLGTLKIGKAMPGDSI